MGLRPAIRLPLWSYKSKLLTPKPKACQHLLTEGIHPLQGDKQKNILWVEVHSKCIHLRNGIVYNIIVTEGRGIVTEEELLVIEEVLLVTEDKVFFYVAVQVNGLLFLVI